MRFQNRGQHPRSLCGILQHEHVHLAIKIVETMQGIMTEYDIVAQ